jgi:hypothetical protein
MKEKIMMRGIILINPKYSINDLNLSDSFAIQKILTEKFITDQNISQITLNRNQIYPYYTIPHVLLYHLQKETEQFFPLEYLVLYSMDTMEQFIESYPEKWEELCNYFLHVITIVNMDEQDQAHLHKNLI